MVYLLQDQVCRSMGIQVLWMKCYCHCILHTHMVLINFAILCPPFDNVITLKLSVHITLDVSLAGT